MEDGNPVAFVRNRIRNWLNTSSDKYVYVVIPAERTDPRPDEAPIQPYDGYVRLWLADMFLAYRASWGVQQVPAVHAELRLPVDRKMTAFSRAVRPSEDQFGPGVRLNYAVTELLPFNGGVVEIEAALFALPGANHLAMAVDVLSAFSDLVAPPVGRAVAIAQKVSSKMHDLVVGSGGKLHLGMHQTFTSTGGGQTPLRAGYIAVVLATPEQVAPSRLSVREGRLWLADDSGPGALLTSHDHLLLYVEGRQERDDWRLDEIELPLQKAILAFEEGDEARALAYRSVALAAAWQSPDLTRTDRRRAVQAIKGELADVQSGGLGAIGPKPRTLEEVILDRAMLSTQAAALGALGADEVFGAA